MKNKKNKMKSNVTRKLSVLIATAMIAVNLLAATVMAQAPVEPVQVGEETEEDMSVSVNNGLCILKVDGGWSIQLTPSLVTKSAVVDQTTRTAYLILDTQRKQLKAYNYDLQKEMSFQFIDIAEGVTGFSGTTGYIVNGDTVSFPTLQELKVKLGIEEPDNPSDQQPSDQQPSDQKPDEPQPSDPDQPDDSEEKAPWIIIDGNVIYSPANDWLNIYFTLPTSEAGKVDDVAVSDNGIIYIKYDSGRLDLWHSELISGDAIKLYTFTQSGCADLKKAGYKIVGATVGGEFLYPLTVAQLKALAAVQKPEPDQPADPEPDQPDEPAEAPWVIKNGNLIYRPTQGGLTYEYELPTKEAGSIATVALSDNGILYIRYSIGQLDLWHPDLISGEAMNLYTFSKSGCTELQANGYKVVGAVVDGEFMAPLTVAQLKALASVQKPEPEPETPAVPERHTVVAGNRVSLVSSNGVEIDFWTYKNGRLNKIKYGRKTYKVKEAGFVEGKDTFVYVSKDTKNKVYLVTIDTNGKNRRERIAKGARLHYKTDANGVAADGMIVDYAIKADGTKISLNGTVTTY